MRFFRNLFNRHQKTEQRIEPVNSGERDWIAESLRNAHALASQYSQQNQDEALSLETLDRTFKAYIEHGDRTDVPMANTVINAIGIAFGQYLVDNLGLEWVAVTDEFGCDLAVVGMPGSANFLVFPPNFVAKRWERKEVDFLKRSFETIAADYAKFRQL